MGIGFLAVTSKCPAVEAIIDEVFVQPYHTARVSHAKGAAEGLGLSAQIVGTLNHVDSPTLLLDIGASRADGEGSNQDLSSIIIRRESSNDGRRVPRRSPWPCFPLLSRDIRVDSLRHGICFKIKAVHLSLATSCLPLPFLALGIKEWSLDICQDGTRARSEFLLNLLISRPI